ncbi:MAG: MarR family transcriptional regulator [Pseudomonadota bacterium]|nr:MarR family transcriptional regulator [Pseudomonadota bacterium]
MVDIKNLQAIPRDTGDEPGPDWRPWEAGDDVALREAIELLFFAYRDFTAGPDRVLDAVGYGRAHHRVLHFVGRNPGITVQDLLRILRITKQSLARVLGAMINDGYVIQDQGTRDRRLRHLSLTEKGRALEAACARSQHERVSRALRMAGPEAVEGYRAVLAALLDDADRDAILAMIRKD